MELSKQEERILRRFIENPNARFLNQTNNETVSSLRDKGLLHVENFGHFSPSIFVTDRGYEYFGGLNV